MKLCAPAKVNLHLKINGRRPDGFHEIESLIVPVSLADDILVETSSGHDVQSSAMIRPCRWAGISCCRRRPAVFAAYRREFSARIHITKRIPLGAGLGGEAADAATVLIALDAIFETHLGTGDLEVIAARLGSDVPFSFAAVPPYAEAGEIVEPVDIPEK